MRLAMRLHNLAQPHRNFLQQWSKMKIDALVNAHMKAEEIAVKRGRKRSSRSFTKNPAHTEVVESAAED